MHGNVFWVWNQWKSFSWRPFVLQLRGCYAGGFQAPWHVPCGGVCYGDGNLAFIANDWHTALLPVYLKAYYRDNGLMKFARSVLVIHNIAHQVLTLLILWSYLFFLSCWQGDTCLCGWHFFKGKWGVKHTCLSPLLNHLPSNAELIQFYPSQLWS